MHKFKHGMSVMYLDLRHPRLKKIGFYLRRVENTYDWHHVFDGTEYAMVHTADMEELIVE